MENDKQNTVVEQMFQEMHEIQQSGKTLTFDENLALLEKYKEMYKEQMIDCALWHSSRMRNAYQQDNKYYANQSFELWLEGENKIPDYLIFHKTGDNWGVRDINNPSQALGYYATYEEAKIACLKQIKENEQQ
jgi:hypothetical protein